MTHNVSFKRSHICRIKENTRLLPFFLLFSSLKGFYETVLLRTWGWNGHKALNKQKAFCFGWSEGNIAAQLPTSWDFGITWCSIAKYHPGTLPVSSLGNASWEVKKPWPDVVYMLVSLIYLKNRNDNIRRVLTLSRRDVGRCDSRQCLFSHCLPLQWPCCSHPRTWYHEARSPHPAGGFAGES